MVSHILGQVVAFFDEASAVNDPQTGDSAETVDLYACPDCEVTYIKNDMETCPNCDCAVERTPSFAELGIGRTDGPPQFRNV